MCLNLVSMVHTSFKMARLLLKYKWKLAKVAVLQAETFGKYLVVQLTISSIFYKISFSFQVFLDVVISVKETG